MESETRVSDPSGKLVNPVDALRRFAGVDGVGVDSTDGEMVFLSGDVELFRAEAVLLAAREGADLVPCEPEQIYGVGLPIEAPPRELSSPAPWNEALIAMLQHAFRSGWAHDTLILEQGLEHLVVHGPLRALDEGIRERVPSFVRAAYVLDTTFTMLRALFVLAGGVLRAEAIARVAEGVRALYPLADADDRADLTALAEQLDAWSTTCQKSPKASVEVTVVGLEEALRWKDKLAQHDARRASLPSPEPESESEPTAELEAPLAPVADPPPRDPGLTLTFVLVMLALVVALGIGALAWVASLDASP